MKTLSISLVSAAIMAAAVGANAQTQTQQQPQQAPGASQGQQGGGSGSQGGAPSNDARGGTQAQGAVPGTTDKSTADKPAQGGQQGTAQQGGGADKSKDAAGSADKSKDAGGADRTRDAAGGADKSKDAAGADKSKDTPSRDAAQTPKTESGNKPAEQAQGGSKPAGDGGKSLKVEQKTVIKQTIVQQNIKPAKIDVQVRVGVAVPRTTVLYAPPPAIIEVYPAYRSYRMVLVDSDTILIIDPNDWTIVDIIQV